MHSALLPTQERFRPRKRSRFDQILSSVRRKVSTRSKSGLFVRLVIGLGMMIALCGFLSNQSSSQRISSYNDHTDTVYFYDLSEQGARSTEAAQHGERVLLCMPLRDCDEHLEPMFEQLQNLTYPHGLIDVAFLVSDSTDNTERSLRTLATAAEGWPEAQRFRNIEIFNKDFGASIGQAVSDRHGVKVQGVRRKLMGRARNWLLSTSLRPEHSWVYWRDVDIESAPETLIEDLMSVGRDVVVPNVWRPLPKFLGSQQPYDLNAWVESEAALELAKSLSEDDVIVEGYAEYPTWRTHLAYLRDEDGKDDRNEVMDLDGIGGVSILAKAKVFRTGANFPAFAFENHAETEGFGKMARRMGYSVVGLPQYTVWHRYEPSVDDLKQMEERKAQGLPYD